MCSGLCLQDTKLPHAIQNIHQMVGDSASPSCLPVTAPEGKQSGLVAANMAKFLPRGLMGLHPDQMRDTRVGPFSRQIISNKYVFRTPFEKVRVSQRGTRQTEHDDTRPPILKASACSHPASHPTATPHARAQNAVLLLLQNA